MCRNIPTGMLFYGSNAFQEHFAIYYENVKGLPLRKMASNRSKQGSLGQIHSILLFATPPQVPRDYLPEDG